MVSIDIGGVFCNAIQIASASLYGISVVRKFNLFAQLLQHLKGWTHTAISKTQTLYKMHNVMYILLSFKNVSKA